MIARPRKGAESLVTLEGLDDQRIAYVGSKITGSTALEHYIEEHGYVGNGLDLKGYISGEFFHFGMLKTIKAFIAATTPLPNRVGGDALELPEEFTVPVLVSFSAVSRMSMIRSSIHNVSVNDAQQGLERYWRSLGHGDN